ncbi:MAG: DNA polymerase I [Candidatus Omnitrophica bacterium]|nr:DNA polymerase I [Candidatus Omnitrophota bacterium]MCB9721323.1 DNA polymerase I [Candidatus Omnitrophota bacterium]
MNRLFLIDGHALCYRSFFAIRELVASNGQATNAVYGFVNTLRKILREFEPQFLAVCFDSKEQTLREKKYSEYKIQRPQMPEQLISQIAIIKDVIRAYNVSIFEVPGYEADDIIATLARQAHESKLDVTIVTEDKDMFQLSDSRTEFFSARKDKILKEHDVSDKLGFAPVRITDFIALAGDKSDNIPGVQGIGQVTATKLIKSYGKLEDIYDHIDEVRPDKVRQKLEAQRDMAFLSKELAVLETNVPLAFDLDDLKVGAADRGTLHEIFKRMEFRRLAEEYGDTQAADIEVGVRTLKSDKDVQELIFEVRRSGHFSYLNNEPDDTMFGQLTVGVGEDTVYIVGHDRLGQLRELWEDPTVTKITHNGKEMFKFLARQGIESAGETFDTLLAGYLLALNNAPASPRELAWTYFHISLRGDQLDYKEAALLCRLFPALRERLEAEGLLPLYRDIEVPLSRVLFLMETTGVRLDDQLLRKLSADCQKKIETLSARLFEMAGEEFNVNSPKQLGVILFEKLELPVIKRTKTGYSTDEGVLVKLSEMHEFPSLILEYRQLSKLKSTYLDALPKLVDPVTRRIHAEFNQIGAETGRLSSRHPNLQNIPIRTELGRQVRRAIVPSEGMTLLAADYSQIELRILAHLSGDDALLKAFLEDQDIHRYTASLIFDVAPEEVDYPKRDTAKRVNFGIVYGMSGFGLSKDLGISQPEAQEFIDRYFERYPKVKDFMDEQKRICKERGYVETILHRRRYIPEIGSKNPAVRQFAERQAINTPVQGSAADLMKLAMIKVQEQIEARAWSSRMLITVHDELVFDVDPAEQDELIAMVRETMEHTIELAVPVKIDMKSGPNWLDMDPVSEVRA